MIELRIMLLKEVIELIRYEKIFRPGNQTWADLGCVSGAFTKALADLLTAGSIIYAVDKNKPALEKTLEEFKNVSVKKLHGDFLKAEIPLNLDGIIMANSLHFVKDKNTFVKIIEKHLNKEGSFLIVEYDMDTANPWVPFPISFKSLKILFENQEYSSIIKLNERSSSYQRGSIYSAIIMK